MDDDQKRWLAAVLADPDSDEPRLVMADYLEELGDPRAEFIRVQCELATAEQPSREFYQLQDRSNQLLADHEATWCETLPSCVRKPVFRRGFVSEATVTAKALLKDPDALHAAPFDRVRLNRLKDAGSVVGELPQWSGVRGLDLSDLVIPDADLRALLSSKHFDTLTELDLDVVRSTMDATLAKKLTKAAFQPVLRTLHCCHNLNEDFIPTLARGAGFPELRELHLGLDYRSLPHRHLGKLKVPKLERFALHGPNLTGDYLKEVVALPLRSVRDLNLRGVGLGDEAVESLADANAFDDVVALDVSNHAITAKGVEMILGRRLAGCERFSLSKTQAVKKAEAVSDVVDMLANTDFRRLKSMELSHLREAGLVARLLSSRSLQSLNSLRIDEVTIGKEDMATICESPFKETIRELVLMGVHVTDDAFDALGHLPELLVLNLSTGVPDWEFKLRLSEPLLIDALQSGKLASLHYLYLDDTRLTEKTMQAIADCPYLPELRHLSFMGNHTTDKAVHAIMQSNCLPKLQRVELRRTKGMKNRPKLRKQYDDGRLFV